MIIERWLSGEKSAGYDGFVTKCERSKTQSLLHKNSKSIRASDISNLRNSKDIYMEKSSSAYTMTRLAQQSQKNMKLFNGLNKQEDRRLGLVKDYLRKNYNYEDTLWLRDFVETHRALEDIATSTQRYRGHEAFDDPPRGQAAPVSARAAVTRSSSVYVAPSKASESSSKLLRTRSQLSASNKSQTSVHTASHVSIQPTRTSFTPDDSAAKLKKPIKKVYSKSATFSRAKQAPEASARNVVSAADYSRLLNVDEKKAPPRKPFCISLVNDMSTRLSAEFFRKSQLEKPTSAAQDSSDYEAQPGSAKTFDEETYIMVNTSNFESLQSKQNMTLKPASAAPQSKLSFLLPGHFEPATPEEPGPCSSFPCSLLKSYTSIVGRKNDRNEKQMQSVGLKTVLNAYAIRAKSMTPSMSLTRASEPLKASSLDSGSALDKSDTKRADAIDAGNAAEGEDEDEEWNKYGTNNENQASIARKKYIDFVENKSIRRPLRRSGSSKDFFKRLQALESKVKYCHEQNAINLKSEDRNIRYGDPLPKKKIYRQLRIVSQFESFIF